MNLRGWFYVNVLLVVLFAALAVSSALNGEWGWFSLDAALAAFWAYMAYEKYLEVNRPGWMDA